MHPPYITPAERHESYTLDLRQAIPITNPRKYGIPLDSIDPHQYYITSGEAIMKINYMIGELRDHVRALQRLDPQLYPKLPQAQDEAKEALVRACELRTALEELKGVATYLECSQEGGDRLEIRRAFARDKSRVRRKF